jgi:hypothetical protein
MLRRWNIHHTDQEARFYETSLEYCKIELETASMQESAQKLEIARMQENA